MTLFLRLAAAAALLLAPPAGAATLIVNARLVDGTGAPARNAAVRFDGDRILAVGALQPAAGDTVVDAHGLVLAPGFIDTHSHHDVDQFKDRTMAPLLAQGVTTIVAGQDGFGWYDARHIAGLYAKGAPTVNSASYTGHGWVRSQVLGKDYKRHATPGEVAAMQKLLAEDMAAGSLGLSSGLEYDPGIYSDTSELIALARTAKAGGGRYISHMRSEDRSLDAAVDELLAIGRQTGIPVQISHMKIAIVDRWGQAPQLLKKLDAARAQGIDVTADAYPYEYWESGLSVLLPARDFNDRAAFQFALTKLSTPAGMLISAFEPDKSLVGKTIAQIAAARGQDPVDTYMDLVRTSDAFEKAHPEFEGRADGVIGTSMSPADIATLIAWPHTNICSDGFMTGLHPRNAGAFALILRKYVREEKLLSLEAAIHKMSGLGAAHVGLAGRGVIRPGAFADLVILDPATIADHSTVADPNALATGVSEVWVNGVRVLAGGKPTAATPGRFLKRGGGA